MSVVVPYGAGFFSCCSVRLYHICDYINKNHKHPESVDSSKIFTWYKNEKEDDITFDYFKHYSLMPTVEPHSFIDYHWGPSQYVAYRTLNYSAICPLIQKYFTPSPEIMELLDTMEKKYNLDYSNTCALFYRGNDKNSETYICGYEDYVKRARDILIIQPSIVFLIQSDETEFIDLFTRLYPNNSIVLRDEIRHMNKCNDTVDKKFSSTNFEFSKKYLAITLIMSKCKYVVCGSGNCSIWIMFYRGHANRVCQQLNNTWFITQK